MKKRFQFIVLFLMVFTFSCKTSKTIGEGAANLKLSTKELIKENAKLHPNFNTLQAKLKITLNKKEKTQTHTVNFRVKKDKMLWVNASFSVIRALVTPDKVRFYNKLDRTYFDGDYTYLSNLLGTELDFKKVQNLLLGDVLYNLNEGAYKARVNNDVYVLQPKKQNALFEIFFLLDPVHFKLKSQQISQPKKQRHLQIDYITHQEIDKQIFPEQIKIIAVERNEEVFLNLEFKNMLLNEVLRFPFKIPSGFKEIKF